MGRYSARDVELRDEVQDGPHRGPVVEVLWPTELRVALVFICSTCGCRHTLERMGGGGVNVIHREPRAVVVAA